MPSCKCTKPPGGGGQCSSNQMAICRSVNGECQVTCVDLSADLKHSIRFGEARTEQILEFINETLGEKFYLRQTAGRRARFLTSATLVSADRETVVKYTLPRLRPNLRNR